ncbi:hypothetical protein DRQ15_04730 [candidate division KSB1 bacterium]|nr:hypothetical protein [bacterium]OQX59451.1 MAG: hypothetical protein B5M50_02870 [candidate division KSB1 bacterium 4484_219]RKY80041.1 MAG: hypothetical protein DRQ12_02215 [candidate division KSB1 bacterium]RKY84404.1 MAG: hypothetical protein DRP98_05040 [candidate division KSB1 bacterium]RKY87757.1 MAG: hypothetical protein DRQ11_05450 [candidate division KSB1 bacterium]
MATQKEIEQEEQKLRRLRFLVDFTTHLLYQEDMSMLEMLELVEATKQRILELFPDKEETYNLIYKPRFERIIRERLGSN